MATWSGVHNQQLELWFPSAECVADLRRPWPWSAQADGLWAVSHVLTRRGRRACDVGCQLDVQIAHLCVSTCLMPEGRTRRQRVVGWEEAQVRRRARVGNDGVRHVSPVLGTIHLS